MSVEHQPIVPPQRGRGRPSDYNPEIMRQICAEIATSPDSLETICNSNPAFPHWRTAYAWLSLHEEFQQEYARAREMQTEIYVQDMVSIARSVPVERDAIQKAKLEIDTLKWAASKLKPKKYGDGITLRGDKENPLEIGLANMLDAVQDRRKAIEGEYSIIQPMAAIESKPADLPHTDVAGTIDHTPVERS